MKNYFLCFILLLLVNTLLCSNILFADEAITPVQSPDPFTNLNHEFGLEWQALFAPSDVKQNRNEEMQRIVGINIFRSLFLLLKPDIIPSADFISQHAQLYDDLVLDEQNGITSPEGGKAFSLPADIATFSYMYSNIPIRICEEQNAIYVIMPGKHNIQSLNLEKAKLYAKEMADKLLTIDMVGKELELISKGADRFQLQIKNDSKIPLPGDFVFTFSKSYISCRYIPYPYLENISRGGKWFETATAFDAIQNYVSNWDNQYDNQFELLAGEVDSYASSPLAFNRVHTVIEKEEVQAAKRLQKALKFILNPKLIINNDDFMANLKAKSTLQNRTLHHTVIYQMSMGVNSQLPVMFSKFDDEIRLLTMLGKGYRYDAKKGYIFEDDDLVKTAFMRILNNYFRWVPNPEDVSIERQKDEDKIYIHVTERSGQPYRIKDAVFFKHGQYMVIDRMHIP